MFNLEVSMIKINFQLKTKQDFPNSNKGLGEFPPLGGMRNFAGRKFLIREEEIWGVNLTIQSFFKAKNNIL